MGKFMKNFKKLAVLAMTVSTVLACSSVSFAMKSPVQSVVDDSQQQFPESIDISLNQLILDGQCNVLFNQSELCNDANGSIAIQNDFSATDIQNIFIVNGLFHDEYGCIYNRNGDCFTYDNGQPIQLPLPSEQYYYDTFDNSLFEQEEIEEQVGFIKQK